MTILRHIACAAALLAATAANATTYNYSYTFSSGGVVTGSFDGTASGNLITGLSNVSVFRDGTQFGSGNLYSFGLDYGNAVADTAVVSFDGLANSFVFSTSSIPAGGGFYHGDTFSMDSGTAYPAYIQGAPGWAKADNHYSAARWSVTAAVPEPSTYAMLLGGLGLVGAIARRRRAV